MAIVTHETWKQVAPIIADFMVSIGRPEPFGFVIDIKNPIRYIHVVVEEHHARFDTADYPTVNNLIESIKEQFS